MVANIQNTVAAPCTAEDPFELWFLLWLVAVACIFWSCKLIFHVRLGRLLVQPQK